MQTKAAKKLCFRIGIILMSIGFLGLFIPTSKQIITIYAVDKTLNVIEQNKDKIDEISGKTYKLLNQQLDKYLEDGEE